jgi:hypothetical protein
MADTLFYIFMIHWYSFDSDEELFFSYYLNELEEHGVIKEWSYHPEKFLLSERIVHIYEKQLKTKSIIKDSVILNNHEYQADFFIRWNPQWYGKIYMSLTSKLYVNDFYFIASNDKHFTVVDVKGTFAGKHNNSAISFPLDQKWTYQKYGIYVQKIVPVPRLYKGKLTPSDSLFPNTFTPKKYLLTPTGMARKINFKVISITQYLNSISE